MTKQDLNKDDEELITFARREFEREMKHDWHGVSCALRLKSGKVYTGLVLEAEVPALTVCAEPIVIGKALNELEKDLVSCIVATRGRDSTEHKVIPPCGRCREFIADYCQEASVIVFDESEQKLCKVSALDLLPFKYLRLNT